MPIPTDPSASAPQPMAANPSRTNRLPSASNASLRMPPAGRMGASPMSFGAAMSGISFTNGGGFSFGKSGGGTNVPGSYGARFYGDGMDSPSLGSMGIPFSTSINMDGGSYAANSAAFGLPINLSSSYHRRSYAAAVSGRDTANYLSASLASLGMGYPGQGSYSHSYSRGQLDTLMSMKTEAEHTKEYMCCGEKHNGLHALLEHVEETHPFTDPNAYDAGFSPVTLAMELDLEGDVDTPVPSTTNSARSSTSPRQIPSYPLTPTSAGVPKSSSPVATTAGSTTVNSTGTAPVATLNVDPSSLQLSELLKSPPNDIETRVPSTTSSSPEASLATPTASTHSSPAFAPPKITAGTRGAFLGQFAKPSGPNRFDRAFNEVVAGKSGPAEDPANAKPPGPTAVAPGVLFTHAAAFGMPAAQGVVGRQGAAGQAAPNVTNGKPATAAPTAAATGAATTPAPTTAAAATAAPGAENKPAAPADVTDENKDGKARPPPPPNGDRKAVEPALPPPSLFTTHKAWRCPNPGCNKAYKQSNGLKYHLQKGQCDYAIHDAIDHGLTLEEAEERARPYVCAVGAGCTKRYRQMNGLKYHYLNSGEHGQYGLRMLQNGTHPHPPSLPPPPKRDRTGQQNAGARPAAAPYSIPRPATPGQVGAAGHQAAPRMGTWPAQQGRPNGTAPTGTTPHTGPLRTGHMPVHQTNPSVVARGPVTPQVTSAAPATVAPAKNMAPVQRGRDAVLFSSVDPLDV